MTVGELIMLLEEFDEDAPVRLAEQPRYPLACSVAGVGEHDGVVYIAEGSQIGYLPGGAADAVGFNF